MNDLSPGTPLVDMSVAADNNEIDLGIGNSEDLSLKMALLDGDAVAAEKSNTKLTSRLSLTDDDKKAANDFGITLAGSCEDGVIRAAQLRNMGARLWLESGYWLMWAKAETDHGKFSEHCEKHGFSPRMAQELMSAARLYTKADEKQREQMLALGQTKTALLAHADPEVIDAILEDEDVNVSALTLRDLRRCLKEAEAERDVALAAKETIQTKLNTAEMRADRLLRESADPEFSRETTYIRSYCAGAMQTMEIKLAAILDAFAGADKNAHPESAMQMEQAWIAANVIAARALDVVAKMKEAKPEGLPERAFGRHCMTPTEAERWCIDAQMILNAEAAGIAALKGEDAAPRKRGRPRKDAPKA
jgi:hypothetical protein